VQWDGRARLPPARRRRRLRVAGGSREDNHTECSGDEDSHAAFTPTFTGIKFCNSSMTP
jgi:hypothetical protein